MSFDAELSLAGRRLAFTVKPQGVTCLLGRPGSGRRALLRALAGLDSVKGQFRLDGAPLPRSPSRRPVGIVFSEPRLFPRKTVRENLRYGLRRRGALIDFDTVVERLNLSEHLTRRAVELSPQEAYQVALGRAALAGARLVLVDEPCLGGAERHALHRAVSRLADLPLALLVSTSSPYVAAGLSNSLLYLHSEGFVGGSVNALVTNPDLDLIRHPDATTRIRGVVAGHDPSHRLTYLDCRGGRLFLAPTRAHPGSPMMARVRSEDVLLSTEAPKGAMTTLSAMPGKVLAIAEDGGERVVVVKAGDAQLLARASSRAVAEMKLSVGGAVYALVRRAAAAAD